MTAFFGKLSFSLFGLLLLADEGGDELDYLVLLSAREIGDFLEYLLDFAGGTGLRLFRFAAQKLVGGDVQYLGDLQDQLAVQTDRAALVIGNDGLRDAEPFGPLRVSIGRTEIFCRCSSLPL